MSQAFGRDAGSAVSPLPGVHVLAAVPSAGRPSFAGGPARAPQAAATEGLYERHAAKIFSYCLHQLGSREEAEDAVQTAFMNAFRALGRGVVPEAESAWLFKIAENVCLSRRRSSWRRGRIESPSDFEVIEEVVPGPSRQRDELIGIEDALASMPEQQRRAILLREWQGLSYREIGEELEVSQSAVETLIFRARRSLAQGLEQPDLAKKPQKAKQRKSFRRALHVIDLGTIAAAVKTLLAGSVAVKATAAAVAVTAAATAVSVTPKREGHAPVPAEAAALVAPAAAKKQAGEDPASVVAASGGNRPTADGPSAPSATQPARAAGERPAKAVPTQALVARRLLPAAVAPAPIVSSVPVQLPVAQAPVEQAPPASAPPAEAAPAAAAASVEQPVPVAAEAPKHEPPAAAPERPAAERKQERKQERQRGPGKRRDAQPVPVHHAAAMEAPPEQVVVPEPAATEAPTEHKADGGEPKRERGARQKPSRPECQRCCRSGRSGGRPGRREHRPRRTGRGSGRRSAVRARGRRSSGGRARDGRARTRAGQGETPREVRKRPRYTEPAPPT